MSESKLQSDLITALCLDTRVAWAMAITSGKIRIRGAYVTVGQYSTEDMKRKTGVSDILAQLADGRTLAVEVKMPGEVPTLEQQAFLALVSNNGGVSGWVTSIHELYELLYSHCGADNPHNSGP